jgi:NAD-dependent deacetylase
MESTSKKTHGLFRIFVIQSKNGAPEVRQMKSSNPEAYKQAAEILRASKRNIAFTGAGISVESGIPPFRGVNGLWSKYDPIVLDIDYFYSNPYEAWIKIKEIFYDFFGKAKPNAAHISIANLEKKGLIKSVITQNIDNLHQEAGSETVYEFHGNSQKLICTNCNKTFNVKSINLDNN